MPIIGPLTEEDHAMLGWAWLCESLAPSTRDRMIASAAVRHPEIKGWPTTREGAGGPS